MEINVKHCPLCKQSHLAHVSLANGLKLVRCQSCSLVFLDWPEDSGRYIEAMETDFFGRGAIKQRDAWARWFSVYQAKRRLKLISRYCKSGTLLEIGCGTGEFLSLAKASGFKTLGIELSSEMADYAVAHYDLSVYRKRLEEVELTEPFDVVVMNHVLEHMETPLRTLTKLRSLMREDSILYIAVPNVASWEAHFRGWTSYEPYHLFYYSPATLIETLKQGGFETLHSSTFEPFSGWTNTLLRSTLQKRYFMERGQGPNRAASSSYRPRAAMALLNTARLAVGGLTAPLRWMQAKLGKGEELITIAAPQGVKQG